jgi:hypothetical protein
MDKALSAAASDTVLTEGLRRVENLVDLRDRFHVRLSAQTDSCARHKLRSPPWVPPLGGKAQVAQQIDNQRIIRTYYTEWRISFRVPGVGIGSRID